MATICSKTNLRSLGNLKTLGLLVSLCTISIEQSLQAAKLDCHPLDKASKENCESLGCVWDPVTLQTKDVAHGEELPFDKETLSLVEGEVHESVDTNVPWCYFSENYTGYTVASRDTHGQKFKLTRQRPSGLPNDLQELFLDIDSYGEAGSPLRIRIYDSQNMRYEPDIPKLNLGPLQTGLGQFEVEVNERGHLVVKRKSTGAILFDTDLKRLIFSDKFIQLNSKLYSSFVYGLGEHYGTFLKSAKDNYKTYSFYHTDRLTLPGGQRSYGTFPFYINLDSNNLDQAHGVYLRNSNGMDIILQPDQSITFRPIGGILDFFILPGPTPNDVIQQYQNLVGLPDLPPRWALGFHLCRYNYNSIEKTESVWRRTREAGIPFDAQWNDIDYMDRHNDFTYDKIKFKGLPDFVEKLHENNMHYVILFDPGVSMEENYYPYSLGESMDIFVKNSTNQTLIGKVWNDSGKTVFPDFSNPKSIDYWTELFIKMQEELKFDGAWIDMNDISNFVFGSLDGCPMNMSIEQPVYRPGGYNLQEKSLCLSARHKAGYEYDVHNLYSFYEAIATSKALSAARPGKRPLIISRSTSPGQGHYGGHWSGDVLATWDYLKWSIPSLIEHNMYGFSMMGSDICGFSGNTNPELCARWSTLGAFYTFTRNHNDDKSIDQDPVALGKDVVEANKNALKKKYSLIPYIYTLLHRAHKFGEPAIRSVPFEFFRTDKESLKVEYQFMWGSGLMISPVVDQNTYTKSSYLPKGRWYESNIVPTPEYKPTEWIDSNGQWKTTNGISLADIPLFYRGGHIIPYYEEAKPTTIETANQPISLQVALCSMSKANGELYIDEGDNTDGKYNHITMRYENNKLTITQDKNDFAQSISFGQLKILGVGQAKVSEVKVNGQPVPFNKFDHEVVADLKSGSVSNEQPLVIELI